MSFAKGRPVRIRYIEIFHAVMQAGSVQGAAKLLHITQPAATRLVQQAENSLGVSLFQRQRGRLIPTAEAHRLYPEVERLYLQLDSVRRVAVNLVRGPDSQLRVLCVPGLALEGLPKALGAWGPKHPEVHVSLRTLHSHQIAQALVLREAELGFGFEASPHPAVLNQAILGGRLVCVGRDLPKRRLSLQELDGRAIVGLDPIDPLGRSLQSVFEHHQIEPDARITVHSYHAAIELAAHGFGWALVDSFTAAYAQRHPELRIAQFEEDVPVTVYALRVRDAPSSVSVEQLIAAMVESLKAPRCTTALTQNSRAR